MRRSNGLRRRAVVGGRWFAGFAGVRGRRMSTVDGAMTRWRRGDERRWG